jgi:hypothetical protein
MNASGGRNKRHHHPASVLDAASKSASIDGTSAIIAHAQRRDATNDRVDGCSELAATASANPPPQVQETSSPSFGLSLRAGERRPADDRLR